MSGLVNQSGLRCVRCDKPVDWNGEVVWVGHKGLVSSGVHYCPPCAGYSQDSGGFDYGRERVIRGCVPFRDGVPACVIADWLEENDRRDAAAFMRGLESGG